MTPNIKLINQTALKGVLFLPARHVSQAELFGFFFQKINLHGQLTNLGMEPGSFLFEIFFSSALSALEYADDIFCQHFLPFRDLRGMYIIFLRDLVDGFFFLYGLKCHPRLECAIMSSTF